MGRLVRKENHSVSNDRVRQVRRQEGLLVPPQKKKQRRLGQFTGRHPQKASYPGHEWTWDFVHDCTLKGGSCRILNVVDEYTRQAHCLHVAKHIGSKTVQSLMQQLIAKPSVIAFIRSDNGPEFIDRSLGEWLKEQGIKTLYIDPGSPWQNVMSKVSTTRSGENAWGVKYSMLSPNVGLW